MQIHRSQNLHFGERSEKFLSLFAKQVFECGQNGPTYGNMCVFYSSTCSRRVLLFALCDLAEPTVLCDYNGNTCSVDRRPPCTLACRQLVKCEILMCVTTLLLWIFLNVISFIYLLLSPRSPFTSATDSANKHP